PFCSACSRSLATRPASLAPAAIALSASIVICPRRVRSASKAARPAGGAAASRWTRPTKRAMAGTSIWVWLERCRSAKRMPKLIACAASRAAAITKAICPIRLLGRKRFTQRRSQPLHLGRKHVAAAPDGLDQLGIGGIGLDLLPEAADMIVDAA